MNAANVSSDRQRLQEIGDLANELAREFAEFGERISATLQATADSEIESAIANALPNDGEDPMTHAGDPDTVELLVRAADAWERTLHRKAVAAAARTRPGDAAAGRARTITAFLVAKPAFPQTEVLEIRRGLNSDGGPGKLLALVDDPAAAATALQAILSTMSPTRTPRGPVNRALAGADGQSYLLDDREQLARAAAVMAGSVADAQEAAVAALRALEKLEAD